MAETKRVRHLENLMETTLAEVTVDDENFLVILRKADCEVGANEALTFTSERASNKNGLEAIIDAGELQVST